MSVRGDGMGWNGMTRSVKGNPWYPRGKVGIRSRSKLAAFCPSSARRPRRRLSFPPSSSVLFRSPCPCSKHERQSLKIDIDNHQRFT